MPIYEYYCRACGEEFEKLVLGQAMVVCPGCASREVSRRMSRFGVKSGGTFAGSGSGGCACASGGGCGCR
ncbi:MAG: zinc ribbon domain-containing protein [Candidatus Rokubacteria bacterium]|nr:zinc ribbon domain-containing protein [Candidatus Rokubacteria bacterium]